MIKKRWEIMNLNELINKLEKIYLKKTHSFIFFPLAYAYYKADLPNKAEVILRAGLSFYPKYWGAKALLGKILYEKDELRESKQHLEIVLRMVPENMLAQKLLFQIYKKIGLNKSSEEEVRVLEILEKTEGYKKGEIKFIEKPKIQIPDESLSVEKRISLSESLTAEKKDEELLPTEVDISGLAQLEKSFIQGDDTERAETLKQDGVPEQIDQIPLKQKIIKPESEHQEIITATLAELYFNQGLFDRAIDIYTKLIIKQPDREDWINRVKEIQKVKDQNEKDVKKEGIKEQMNVTKMDDEKKRVIIKLDKLLKNTQKMKQK